MTTAAQRRNRTETPWPSGGYRLMSVGVLYGVWWAYRRGHLTLRDVRTFFAAMEMASRRCMKRQGTHSRFTLAELRAVVHAGTDSELRHSIARLADLGVATITASSIRFAMEVNSMGFDMEAFSESFQQVANRKRRVPVPRRTIRFLAKCRSAVTIATVLGHLFRCVYAKGLNVAVEGSISASWVAAVFEMDIRSVKRARAALINCGWLRVCHSDHWHRQRYGSRVSVNLEWAEESSRTMTKSPPRTAGMTGKLPPPETNRKLLEGSNNQKPTAGNGVHIARQTGLGTVSRDDLANTDRLLELYRSAEKLGWVKSSESARLDFLAAAARARRCATRNPGGFFVTLVRRGLWHYLHGVDEEDARRRLIVHREGICNRQGHVQRRVIDPVGVRLVAEIHQLANARGYSGDPFLLINNQPGWDRERWDQAMRVWLNPRTQVCVAG